MRRPWTVEWPAAAAERDDPEQDVVSNEEDQSLGTSAAVGITCFEFSRGNITSLFVDENES